MYVDALLLFSDAQAITAAAASTSYIDFGAVRDMGTGEDLYVVVTCDVAMTDGSSDSTLAVAIEGVKSQGFLGIKSIAQSDMSSKAWDKFKNVKIMKCIHFFQLLT